MNGDNFSVTIDSFLISAQKTKKEENTSAACRASINVFPWRAKESRAENPEKDKLFKYLSFFFFCFFFKFMKIKSQIHFVLDYFLFQNQLEEIESVNFFRKCEGWNGRNKIQSHVLIIFNFPEWFKCFLKGNKTNTLTRCFRKALYMDE